MKKIAIVTLNGYTNYGNRLQNYALQETIESLGFETETLIVGDKPNYKKPSIKEKMNRLVKKNPQEIFCSLEYKAWKMINKDENNESKKIRMERFKKFTYDYINETDFHIVDRNIPKGVSDKYDYFIAGSDQIWNPNYNYGSSIYFLTFAEKNKRVAYAPSFGVSEIDAKYIDVYKEWISSIEHLSVREADGAKIIRELTGRCAPVLVDPTLLLTKKKWLSIASVANSKPEGEYLLTYFLGEVSERTKSKINSIAKKSNLTVINLGVIKEKETYRTGPSEFIDYINSCSIFFTDSFHGTVFSILMEKPFIVCERRGRYSMFSRINTLLDKFKLNSQEECNMHENKDVFDVDYSHVPKILKDERNKSIKYLKEALSCVEASSTEQGTPQ